MPFYQQSRSRRLLILIAVMFPLIVSAVAQAQRGRGGQAPATGTGAGGRAGGGDQEPGDGRGAAPNPLGQPLVDANGFVKDDAMLHSPPLAPEDRKYADIVGMRMKQILMEVDAISLKDRDSGNLFWGRNVGTKGHDDTQAWVESYFKKNNLQNVHRIPFDLAPQWTPKSYELTFKEWGTPGSGIGSETTFVRPILKSARPAVRMASTPPEGVEYDLVWAGNGTAADFAGKDVRGKAVLIQDIPLPGDIRHSAQIDGVVARAFDKGAAAVGLMFGISDNFAIWQGAGARPGFNVGFEDGKVLRDAIGAGRPVKVNIKMTSEMKPGLKTASVIGTLPGRAGSTENITILAHMDGYFRASLDNASGLAVLMGLLEHYAKVPQAERAYSIRFVGSAGHHGGPGARWFHDNLTTDQGLGKTVLGINLEHVAVVRTKYWGNKLRMTTGVGPMRWWVWGSKRLMDATLDAFQRFNVGVTADMDPGASGEMGSMARDVPTIQVITSPEIKHTEQDTPEWVPSAGLEQIARAYARIIDEVGKMTRAQLRSSAK